jgi:plasmid stabilization system protein ParE
LKFTLHPAAERDLADAARFSRREAGRAVALRFLDEFEPIAPLVAEQPGLGTPTAGGRRWFPPHGFPYAVICRPTDDGVRILVVRHQHRDPDFGQTRR